MVHWSFLIAAFFAGAGMCYLVLWLMTGVYAELVERFRHAADDARFE